MTLDQSEHRAKWDSISLSLVLNFVPEASDRGEYLSRKEEGLFDHHFPRTNASLRAQYAERRRVSVFSCKSHQHACVLPYFNDFTVATSLRREFSVSDVRASPTPYELDRFQRTQVAVETRRQDGVLSVREDLPRANGGGLLKEANSASRE